MATRKGTVTPLSEVLPLQEFAKAAGHIDDAIRDQGAKLEELKRFSQDNKELHKLIQELPHNVSYNIMVPFGKAAFFPGKLVHTNEMMVLLGEGYYAERSAKQTLEILTRRSRFLNSNIDSVNAQIADLRAEAAFAKNAAEEVAAGVVDIREEYVEPVTDDFSAADSFPVQGRKNPQADVDDEEHDRIMARLAELEAEEDAEEEAAESEESDQDESIHLSDEEDSTDAAESISRSMNLTSSSPIVRSPADLLQFEDWKDKTWKQTETERREDKTQKRVSFNLPSDIDHKLERKVKQATNSFRNKTFVAQETEAREAATSSKLLKSQHEFNKAFPGVVVERNSDLLQSDKVLQEKSANKPVSRFKQRLAS